MEDPFAQMALDPREAAHADLRSSALDRDAVLRALGEAYAEGRLDRTEHDERSERVQRSRTLGELPPVLSDLLPRGGPAPRAPAGAVAPAGELRRQAEEHYQRERRQAVWSALSATLVCVAIWLLTGGASAFFWPAFVILGTGLNAGRVVFQRDDIVADHVRSLERKQAKAEARRRREVERPTESHDPDD